VFLKLFYKIEREIILPNSFYEVCITPTTKSDKDIMKNYKPISLVDAEILNKILASQI
jgi:hypothetical protein